MKVAGNVSAGQGVRRGCVWNFEWCSNSHAKPHTERLGTGGWRLQEDGQHETRTAGRMAMIESSVPSSSRTTRMTVGARASKHPMRS